MAQLGDAHMNVHITWDAEPTEEAKNFIRLEVLKVLQREFQEASWFAELVRTEVHEELKRTGLSASIGQVPMAAQEEFRRTRGW